MARIRNIKPEFFDDEGLGALSRDARLLFIGLWTQADREGRLEDRPARLKVRLFPFDADIDAKAVSTLISELASDGCVVRYTVAGRPYLSIPKFSEHQYVSAKEPDSTLPSPDQSETSPIPVPGQSQTGPTDNGQWTRDNGSGRVSKPDGTPAFGPSLMAGHRQHRSHVVCGTACVPAFLHDEFLRALNRPADQRESADDELRAGYRAHLAAIEGTGVPVGDVHTFWRGWFKATYGGQAKTLANRAALEASIRAIEAV